VNPPASVWRGFSGHWMAFYSAALAVLCSAAHTADTAPRWANWLEGRKREVDKDVLGSDHDFQLSDHGDPIRLTTHEIDQPTLARSDHKEQMK
jgi:hypothetical protein